MGKAAGNHFMDQSALHDLIYENMALSQERELKKSYFLPRIIRVGSELLEVITLKWQAMSKEQWNMCVINVFRSCIASDGCLVLVIRKPQVQPDDCKDMQMDLPLRLIRDMWYEAEVLLSHWNMTEMHNDKFCITDGTKSFLVSGKGHWCHCWWDQFHELDVCCHIFAVADEWSWQMS